MRWLIGICGLLVAGTAGAEEPLAPLAPTPRDSGELPPRVPRLRWRSEVQTASHETRVAHREQEPPSKAARVDDLFETARGRASEGLHEAERDAEDALSAARVDA